MKYRCVICNTNNKTIFLFKNFDYISQKFFTIKKCINCNLVFTVFENKNNLNEYYPDSYYKNNKNFIGTSIQTLMKYSRFFRAYRLNSYFSKPGKILDIGCGSAFMLSLLSKKGWDCYGTERSSSSASAAMKDQSLKIIISENIENISLNMKFDVISMFHVLEHVNNPMKTIAYVKKNLKDKGFLIIEVPNFDSFQSKLTKGKWFHIDAPRHLYHFSYNSLKNILDENNFKIISFETYSLEMGFYGILQSFLNYFPFRHNFLYGFLLDKNNKKINFISLLLFLINIFISIFLFIPLFIIEIISVFLKKGSVIRIIARLN